MEQFPHTALQHPLQELRHSWQVIPKQDEHGWQDATTLGFKAHAVDENLTQDTHKGAAFVCFWEVEKSIWNIGGTLASLLDWVISACELVSSLSILFRFALKLSKNINIYVLIISVTILYYLMPTWKSIFSYLWCFDESSWSVFATTQFGCCWRLLLRTFFAPLKSLVRVLLYTASIATDDLNP